MFMKRLICGKMVLVAVLSLALSSLAEAREVRGRVHCGRTRLEHVVVTDGKSFATTNSRGCFSMEVADSADFVYVVTPEGYAAPRVDGIPVFYQRVTDADRYDFELVRSSRSKDYSIIAMADPQAANEKHFALFQKKVMPDLLATIAGQKKTFDQIIGIVLGDIVWDNMNLVPAFKKEFARTEIPVYPVIGNHDYVKEAQGDYETAQGYRQSFGPENYAFCIGGDYVVVLDDIVYDTQKHYVESFTDEQIRWVSGLLEYIPEESHIWLCMHCPMRRWFSPSRPWLGKGREMLEVLEGRDYTVLSGHTHINNVSELDSVHLEHNIAAACGAWWVAGHCTDGTPAGYKVFEKKEGKLSWHYKSLGKEKDFQMEVFLPGESEFHPDAVIANIWDHDSRWKVEWSQDDRAMGAMEQVTEISPNYVREINARYTDKGKMIPRFKMPHNNTHYFMAVPSPDAKVVTVIVTDRFGKEYRETVEIGR